MEEPKATQTPATNPDAPRSSPHPFINMLFQGMLDILDETDIQTHLGEEEVKKLMEASERLRTVNPLKERLDTSVGTFVVTFEVSLRELIEFGCLRSSLQVNSPETSCMRRPFLDHESCVSEQNPPGWLESIKLQEKVLPMAMNAKIVCNEFAGLLKEPIKFGASVSEKYLEVMSAVDRGNVLAQNYRASLVTKTLTFNIDTSMNDTVQLAPMMPDTELNRVCTMGFLTREIVERGVLKHKIGEKTFYYFPEEHGLSHVLKIGGPSLISGVRVYALALPHDSANRKADEARVFVRVPEKAYEAAMDYLFSKELDPKLDRVIPVREIAFWIGYKTPSEQWTDEKEKARILDLCKEDLDKKHKIAFKITAALAMPSAKLKSAGQDFFWSSPAVIGSYLPGMPFVDGCSSQAKKSEQALGTNRTYKDIRARALPHYLKEHKAERKAFKEHQNKDYHDALIDV